MREVPIDPYQLNELDWHQDAQDEVSTDNVRDAVDRLPRLQRDIVNGLFYEGVTKSEMGRRLGLTRAEVDSALEKAMVRMRGQVIVG